MSGWSFERGMSNNAVYARSCGRKPLSSFTKGDLSAEGWTETKKLALWLAKAGVWKTSEIHHTGKYFAETRFYDPAELVDLWDELPEEKRKEFRWLS